MADIARDDDGAIDISEDAPASTPEPGVVELPEGDVADDAKLPSQAVLRADGTVFLPLSFPVTLKFKKGSVVSEEETTSFVFHPLTGKDMQVIGEKPQAKVTVTAIARSARTFEVKMQAIFERMDARDVNAAERCVMHFLDGGRPTGR